MVKERLELGLEKGVTVVLLLVGSQHLNLEGEAVRVGSCSTYAYLPDVLISYWSVFSLVLAQPFAL